MPRYSNERILTEEALMKLMKKGTKGFVTELTNTTKRILKNNVDELLYGQVHTDQKTHKYRDTYTDHNFAKSITSEKTNNTGESWTNTVYFDSAVLYRAKQKKTKEYLGRYMDLDGVYTGDDLIEWAWLEDDLPGLVPRTGSHFLEATMQEVDDWLSGAGCESVLSSEMGDIVIERFK